MNKPKNVCVVTYSNSGNYGAALQLFATYKAVEKLGYKAQVLNYENKYEAAQNSWRFLFQKKPLKQKLRTAAARYVFGAGRNGKHNFGAFYADRMDYTCRVTDVAELGKVQDADVFCVGSDQVWNPQITGQFDPVFLLDSPDVKKKISFASSMGSLNFEIADEQNLVRCLSDFSALAVREPVAQDYLQKKLNRPVELTLDPTLHFDRTEWGQMFDLEKLVNPIQEKYVLIYALGDGFDSLNKLARSIADRIGAKTAVITLSSRKKPVDYCIHDATPEMFVKLIREAAFVVTNSFHGTCFSIINQVPFYSVKFGSNPKRVEGLLQRYDLCSRFYEPGNPVENAAFDNRDVAAASRKVTEDSVSSLNWLKEAIQNA